MAVVEVSVVPLSIAGSGLSLYIAEAVRIARESGLQSQLTAMGTIIEGDLDAVLQVVRRMHEAPFTQGVDRVYTVVKIDDRRDQGEHSMAGKVRSVEANLPA